MNETDIVLVDIMTSDGSYKTRPALVLKKLPKYNDLLLSGISSQTHQEIPNFDYFIDENSIEFNSTGLLKSSIIRLGFLTVLPSSFIVGKIGSITKDIHQLLLIRLSDYLLK